MRISYVMFLMSFILLSCNKEDTEVNLAGNQYETIYLRMEFTGNLLITFEYTTLEECKEAGRYSIIEFKENGDFYAAGELTGTWKQSGTLLTVIEKDIEKYGIIEGELISFDYTESTEDSGSMQMEVQFSKM